MADFGRSGYLGEYILSPVADIVFGATELVRRAQSDRFHWAFLHSAVPLIVPEGVAAVMVFLAAARDDSPMNALRARVDHDPLAAIVVDAAIALGNDRPSQEFDAAVLQDLARLRSRRPEPAQRSVHGASELSLSRRSHSSLSVSSASVINARRFQRSVSVGSNRSMKCSRGSKVRRNGTSDHFSRNSE